MDRKDTGWVRSKLLFFLLYHFPPKYLKSRRGVDEYLLLWIKLFLFHLKCLEGCVRSLRDCLRSFLFALPFCNLERARFICSTFSTRLHLSSPSLAHRWRMYLCVFFFLTNCSASVRHRSATCVYILQIINNLAFWFNSGIILCSCSFLKLDGLAEVTFRLCSITHY